MSPAGSSASFASASSTPGTKASRELVSCRIASVSPGAPKTTSWWASSPGRRTEWIGTSPPSIAAVARAVPDGASSFEAWWYSTISTAPKCSPASRAKRIISTAPSAKLGA